jgi:hypothetical protein
VSSGKARITGRKKVPKEMQMTKIVEIGFRKLADINSAACLVIIYGIALMTDISALDVLF